MASIGCRAGHPRRGPSLEESIELGSWAPLEQMERAAKRRAAPVPPHAGTPRRSAGTQQRWEGRSPMASPLNVPAQLQAHLHFGRTHATRPQQPSPRESSQAARGYSMRCGRSWTPIMQRHQHLDSWEPAPKTTIKHAAKLADVSEKFHKKPVGDHNTRRVNAHAALLRMLTKESEAACQPPPDPREEARRRLQRREKRADADRWDLHPPNQATLERQHAAAMNGSASIMTGRELAASWAANETSLSSSNGWSSGFAASARGRSNIYAHRNTARAHSQTQRVGDRHAGQAATARSSASSHNELFGWPPQSGVELSQPDRDPEASLAARAEAEALRQLLENIA